MVQLALVEESHRILPNCHGGEQLAFLEGGLHASVDLLRLSVDSEVQEHQAPYVHIVGPEHDGDLLPCGVEFG